MRNWLTLWLVMTVVITHAQTNPYEVSTEGIGAIKLGMSQTDLEKLLQIKIPLANITDTVSGSWQDSAHITYRSIPIALQFTRDYFEENKFRMVITGMRTNSPRCKTSNGIGIGADKISIIKAYEAHRITIEPDLIDDTFGKNSRENATLSVSDQLYSKLILFYLVNRKVTGFAVCRDEKDVE